MSKNPISYRLSEECLELIKECASVLGISRTSVIEQAVRKFARVELNKEVPVTSKPNGRRKKS